MIDYMKWIKVSERMPEYNKGVLVFIPEEDYHVTSGMWDISNKWVLLDEYRVPDSKVTHWMESPEIPEEYIKERDAGFEVLKDLRDILRNKK
jgi:hypothetical protein